MLNEEEPSYPSEVVNDPLKSARQVDVSPVIKWLSNLGLDRYAEAFVREEIDWESLKWLTEEVCFTEQYDIHDNDMDHLMEIFSR